MSIQYRGLVAQLFGKLVLRILYEPPHSKDQPPKGAVHSAQAFCTRFALTERFWAAAVIIRMAQGSKFEGYATGG